MLAWRYHFSSLVTIEDTRLDDDHEETITMKNADFIIIIIIIIITLVHNSIAILFHVLLFW